jgi:MazG family protein
LGIDDILELIETLRGENGCPWDKKQTPRTIADYLLEEVYELVDAIESDNPKEVCEELGDVLFHIFFLTSLFRDMGHFDIKEVIDQNIEKMTRRHPHVFGEDQVDSVDEVRERWHNIKMKEKNQALEISILDSVPAKLPALMRAFRISERASKAGFDWSDISGVMYKVEEEWSELKAALEQQKNNIKDQDLLAMEVGDILFTLANVARFVQINPETALRNATKKFEKRFNYMEKQINKSGGRLESVSQEAFDIWWEKAKNKFNGF